MDDGDDVFVDTEDCDFKLRSIHSEEDDDNQNPAAAVSDAVLNAVAANTVAVVDLAVAAAVSDAILNAVAANTVAVADLAVDATFDCNEKTETQTPSPPLLNTSAVAAATAASTVPIRTNITSTTKIQHNYGNDNTSIASSLRGRPRTVVEVHAPPGFLGFILKPKNTKPSRDYHQNQQDLCCERSNSDWGSINWCQ